MAYPTNIMIQKLIEIIKKAVPSYEATFDEASMQNIRLDSKRRENPWCYVEEYRTGSIGIVNYNLQRTIKAEVYFGRFVELDCDADKREVIRDKIMREAVVPFIKAYMQDVDETTFTMYCYYGRFDANEVSICLTFDMKEDIC